MTRKEEIERKAKMRADQYSHPVEWNDCYHHWIEGAEWSDKNPDEKMIAKYLYEKKGYPIDMNGNLPSFDEAMKDAEKYLKYNQDQFINKACIWLIDRSERFAINTPAYYYYDYKQAVEDFKNYMKGE